NMVFKIPRIVSSMSMVMTLEPGDMISTGTPAGVGYFMKPEPKLLSVGDVVEVSIENIGTIRNRVVAEV
ncbi:MAG: fumarylacetoacetate hydrolase family protein, partial [Nitrososphaerota archaeon]